MKVIIAGSRHTTNYRIIVEAVNESGFDITEVISGGARGVDSLGERFALNNNVAVKKFTANWSKHGRAAGPMRNQQMADYADALIAIPSRISIGTRDMIKKAEKAGLTVFIQENP